MAQGSRTLILSAGGLRGLVATATEAEHGRAILLHVRDGRPAAHRFGEAVARQAEHYEILRRYELSMEHLVIADDPDHPAASELRRAPMGAMQLLSAAVSVAVEHKAERIVWPLAVGGEFEPLSRATELAQVVEQMTEAETGSPVRIETPLAEMGLRQVMEAGHRMDVPWELARCCQRDSSEPCGQCPGCRRRQEAFDSAGLQDPLALTPARSNA